VEKVVEVGAPGQGGFPAEQGGTVMALSSKVTAPLRARALPVSEAAVLRVIEVSATIFPMNLVLVPKVAELPTCQKTLPATAPPSKTTAESDAVVKVDPILKTQYALEGPASVKVPVS